MIRLILAASLLLLSTQACRRPIEGAVPVLEYVGISKYELVQNRQDSLIMELEFSDDDGNIGSDTERLLFVYDTRTDSLLGSYLVPRLRQSEEPHRGQGSISIVVYSGCCRYTDGTSCYPNTNQPQDTIRYRVQLFDRDGQGSEPVISERIELLCQ